MFFAQDATLYETPVTTSVAEPITPVMAISDETGSSFGVWLFIYFMTLLAIWIISIVALWNVFEKAGESGWKSIIPFYNYFTLFKIAGINGWMFLLLFVPIANLIVTIMLSLDVAKAFGKSSLFGIFGLWIFSFIGYLILGFGDAKYQLGSTPSNSAPQPVSE